MTTAYRASAPGSIASLVRIDAVPAAHDAGTLHAVIESTRVTPELVRLVVRVEGVGIVDAVAPLGGRVAPGDAVSLRVDVTRLAVLPITR
jgi:thiamine transport system ATP-binding protein